MNEKQQQLTFDKGMTNIPSDAICSDNELEECLNLYYADGEHHPIQSPVEFMNGLTGKVLFVHKLASGEHFIYRTPIADNDQTVYSLKWRTKDDATEHDIVNDYGTEEDVQITALGKTLIVNIPGEEIRYFLWKADAGEYSDLGEIPAPDLIFRMACPIKTIHSEHGNMIILDNVEYGFSPMDVSWFSLHDYGRKDLVVVDNHQKDYDNAAIGSYREALKKIKSKKGFANPFMLRFAVELFDGTYTKLSAPIMMLPSITHNAVGFDIDDAGSISLAAINTFVRYCLLEVSGSYDYSDYSDIVKGVTVFASESVDIYDTIGSQKPAFVEENSICWNSISALPNGSNSSAFRESTSEDTVPTEFKSTSFTNCYIRSLNIREEDEIRDSLKEVSVFYKISELGKSLSTSGGWDRVKIDEHVLENLTTQEQLTDDYYSNCPISANFTTTYNNRLLLAGVKRGFFKGFTSFLTYNQNENHLTTNRNIIIRVWIRTDDGERIVSSRFVSSDFIGKYFFYPDPRAYKAEVYVAGTPTPPLPTLDNVIKVMDLEEHPFLNGAYYLEGLPDGTESMDGTGTLSPGIDDVDTPEYLYNQVFNSEVNNPFVFKAEGNITVGNGKIMALASLTQALSQGQFGQYPLIIFTDEGIFAASIDNTGVVKAVHPMSREVLNNVRSVTQTDGAVFFSSAKGLMVVVGNEVKCVSEQMNGICSGVIFGSFQSYLKNAFIAYDYRDSLLWILNGSSICYLYSIRSGTFSHYHFPVPINNVVNYYPDFLLQDTGQQTSKIYSLMERTPIADDIISTYEGFFTTRPMKFENALALKSIMQIIHIKQIESGTVTMRIFASNNLDKDSTTWVELHSLRGEPWKYYKFRFDFANWKATDTFAGSVVVTQERRIEKLR